MRAKNIYNALIKLVSELNKVSGHIYFFVMDGTCICLHDITCNKIVFSDNPDNIEKFLMKLSDLKTAWRHHNLLRISKNPDYVNMDYITKIQKIYGN